MQKKERGDRAIFPGKLPPGKYPLQLSPDVSIVQSLSKYFDKEVNALKH